MTPVEKELLQDLAGYIAFALQQDQDFQNTITDIAYDLLGITSWEASFAPRTHGYRKYLPLA